MFNLGQQRVRNCDGVSRRAFLRVGSAGVFGLSLPGLLAARASQPAATRKDVNVIVLWMGGGASNIDTFDMKPDAPVEIRGEFKSIQTKLPGYRICEHLPLMAQQMDKVCMLRSVAHTESGDHNSAHHYLLTGYPLRPDPNGPPPNALIYPAYGAVVAKELGWQKSMPPHILFTGKGPNHYHGAGYLGSAYNPLVVKADPNDPKFSVMDVSIPTAIGPERTTRRRKMLAALDDWQRRADQTLGPIAERNRFYAQAYDLITSPAAKRAFNLSDEPARIRDRYGRCRNGQAALLARRLIEAGCRFVTVETHWWDTHANNFKDLKGSRLPDLDQWWSALLDDLAQRGLLTNTLVLWMGEFGRTPTVNGASGRDHWAPANAIGLSGAGIKMGTISGATDKGAWKPVGTPHSTHDFAATVYRLLGIDATKEYITPDGRPVLLNYHGTPIEGVLA